MPNVAFDLDALVTSLDTALDGLLSARLLVGGMPPPLPASALEAALSAAPEVCTARAELRWVVADLVDRLDDDERPAVLAVEEAAWKVVARTAETSWAMAMVWAAARRTQEEKR